MAANSTQLLNVHQVAQRLSIEVDVAERLLEERAVPALRLGSVWLVPQQELEDFLAEEYRRQNPVRTSRRAAAKPPKKDTGPRRRLTGRAHAVRLHLRGNVTEMPSYAGAVASVLETLATEDPGFLNRFSSVTRGKRRYVAERRDLLYDNRPDLRAHRMTNGWWMGTNYSRAELEKMLRKACALAGLEFGADVVITEPEPRTKFDLDRATAFLGAGHSGLGDLASRHDDYLAAP